MGRGTPGFSLTYTFVLPYCQDMHGSEGKRQMIADCGLRIGEGIEHRVRRQESGVRIHKKSNQNFVLDNYWLLATDYRLLDSLIADWVSHSAELCGENPGKARKALASTDWVPFPAFPP